MQDGPSDNGDELDMQDAVDKEGKLLGENDNVVFVGQKPSMAYVLGVITQFGGGQKEVHIRARGKSISRAVDVAEIVRRKFISDLTVRSIDIGTEQRELEDKTKVNVSTIDILLSKI